MNERIQTLRTRAKIVEALFRRTFSPEPHHFHEPVRNPAFKIRIHDNFAEHLSWASIQPSTRGYEPARQPQFAFVLELLCRSYEFRCSFLLFFFCFHSWNHFFTKYTTNSRLSVGDSQRTLFLVMQIMYSVCGTAESYFSAF